MYYADSYTSTVAKITCDEVEFLFNIDLILNQLASGRVLGAAYNLYTFGYGCVYWGMSTLVAAPCWAWGSEQGVVISLRLLSLVSSLGSYWLLFNLLKTYTCSFFLTYLPIMFCFFSPVVITYANIIHPESLFCFFLVLAFYWLHKEKLSLYNYHPSTFIVCCKLAYFFSRDSSLFSLLFCWVFSDLRTCVAINC